MKVKEGVLLFGLHLEMRNAIITADKTYKEHGYEMEITSTTDGIHSPGSLHPYGYAIDIGIKVLTSEQLIIILKQLEGLLNADGYDVILEKDHIHIEYDKILRKAK
jgi:hypothetical protein